MEELALGTLAFRTLTERECYAVLDSFFEGGGTWLDTAFLYGCGEVEVRVGRYLKSHRPPAKLATKIGHFQVVGNYREAVRLREALDAASHRLMRVPDVVFLHEADWRVWWEQNASPGEICPPSYEIEFLDHIVQLSEYVRLHAAVLGLSGNHAAALASILRQLPHGSVAILMVAKQYDLLWRNARAVAEAFRGSPDVECWLGAPFHQGWLFKLGELSERVPTLVPHIDRLKSLLGEHSLSVSDITIPFIRATLPHARIVLGAASVEEVEAALRAARRQLDGPLIAQLLALGFEGEPMPGPISL